MKNRKIVALLCAMVMIITTVSSIITVNAATAPKLSMTVGEKVDGVYPVTVSYSDCDGAITLLDVVIPVPENTTVVGDVTVGGNFSTSATTTARYNARENAVKIGSVEMDGKVFTQSSGVLATFNLKVDDSVTSDIKLEFSEDSSIQDESGDSPILFKVGNSENGITVKEDVLEYVRPRIEGAPEIILEQTYISDTEYTVTVRFDLSEMAADTKMDLVDITIPVPDGVTVSDEATGAGFSSSATITARYNAREKAMKIGGVEMDGNLFTAQSGVLATFKVTITDDLSLTPSEIQFEPLGGAMINTADINYNTLKIKKGEKPAEPTTEPTTAPTTDPAEPTATPVASPLPIKVTATDYSNSGLITDTGKAVKVKLDVIDKEAIASGKVDLVLQGYKVSGKKNVPCGQVIIPDIDINNESLMNLEFTGFVAGATKIDVNVFESGSYKKPVGTSN